MAERCSFESADEVQVWALTQLLQRGQRARPRGLGTLELVGATFVLKNPRMRCITNPERKWNFPLAVGEFCWHASGSNDTEFIEYYIRRWREFSTRESVVRGSCYGHRIFGQRQNGLNLWERIVDLLRLDPDSRRAVITFSDPEFQHSHDSPDVACASALHFLIRSDRLHMLVYMRSNDAFRGLSYDIFVFTMLQELLALELGLELGLYHHTVGSLHLYDGDSEVAKRIVGVDGIEGFEMPPMRQRDQLKQFLYIESLLRAGREIPNDMPLLDNYWMDLIYALDYLRAIRHDSDSSMVLRRLPSGYTYSAFLAHRATLVPVGGVGQQ